MPVTINTDAILALGKKYHAAIEQRVMPKIGRRYLKFCEKSANLNGQGDGDWWKLGDATLDARRRRGNQGKTILRDTARLVTALQAGNTGNLFISSGMGITVGFSGAPHQNAEGDCMPFDELAKKHNLGKGVPVRNLFPKCDEETVKFMQRDAAAILSSI